MLSCPEKGSHVIMSLEGPRDHYRNRRMRDQTRQNEPQTNVVQTTIEGSQVQEGTFSQPFNEICISGCSENSKYNHILSE